MRLSRRPRKEKFLAEAARLASIPGSAARFRLERLRQKFKKFYPTARAEFFAAQPVRSPLSRAVPVPLFDVAHSNFLAGLAPSARWTVLVACEPRSDGEKEKIVGVFVPQKKRTTLRALPEPQVDQAKYDDNRDVVRRLRDSQVGVFGVALDAEDLGAQSPLDAFLGFALRLLPVDGPTSLVVRAPDVERSPKSRDRVLAELKRVRPDAAARLDLTFSDDAAPELAGYARVVADVWACERSQARDSAFPERTIYDVSKVRNLLNDSGWRDSCLLENDVRPLRDAVDAAFLGAPLAPDVWAALAASNAVDARSASLAVATLRLDGTATGRNVENWRERLRVVDAFVDSKAVRLDALRKQLGWLQKYAPQSPLSPRLELVWRTARLAAENHRGAVVDENSDDYKRCLALAQEVFVADAPLALNAILHLAVSFTNAFEFERPRQTLAYWAGRDGLEQTVGPQIYGRILSSLGQYAAFLGENDKAIGYLRDAIQTFERVSDQTERDLDISQTTAYLLIAAFDAKRFDLVAQFAPRYFLPEKYRELATNGKPLGETLAEAAEKLGANTASADKFRHSILTRFLAFATLDKIATETAKAREIYAARAKTSPSDSVPREHPWELTEFYRGVLAPSDVEKGNYFRSARQIARAQDGPTLRVIEAVVLGSLLTLSSADFDAGTKRDFEKTLEQIRRETPNLGAARVAALERQPTAKLAPLALAKAVLPFNFR